MLDGFEFHWPRGQVPYLLDPNNKRIELIVDNFVPYISSGGGSTGRTNFETGPLSTTASQGRTLFPATGNESREAEYDPAARSSGHVEPPTEATRVVFSGFSPEEPESEEDAAEHG